MSQSPAPPPPLPVPTAPPGTTALSTRPTNSLAIVSLVAGIACWVVAPFVGGVVAVVTGHMARSQIRRTGEAGDSMALAGLILGYVHLVVVVLAVAVVILLVIGLFATGVHFSSTH
jgi:hypothetical protein